MPRIANDSIAAPESKEAVENDCGSASEVSFFLRFVRSWPTAVPRLTSNVATSAELFRSCSGCSPKPRIEDLVYAMKCVAFVLSLLSGPLTAERRGALGFRLRYRGLRVRGFRALCTSGCGF